MSESYLQQYIDPISHDPIPPERLVHINMSDKHIEYFDIDHLHTWFVTRGEAINPITNIGFTKKQIQDIRASYIKHKKSMPYFIHPQSSDPIFKNKDYDKHELLSVLCSDETRIEELRDFLYSHSDHIHNDKFDLNLAIPINCEILDTATPIMSATLHNNFSAIQELLIFNPELNYADTKFNYKAIDLAIMSQHKNSYQILKHLLFYGAKINHPVVGNKYCYEITNDPSKLELIYTFMG
jgi:hypothetical protein